MWTAKERAIIRRNALKLAYTLRDLHGGGMEPVPDADVDACERLILDRLPNSVSKRDVSS